jgi:hypothetical protein
MFTLDEWAQIDYAQQEQQWADWERNTTDFPDLVSLFHKPTERLTLEQHRTRLELSGVGKNNFRIPGRGYVNYRKAKG